MNLALPAAPGTGIRFAAALALALLADLLLYGHSSGVAFLLFCAALALAMAALHPLAWRENRLLKAAIPIAALLPLAEAVSALSVLIALVGLTLFALSLSSRLAGDAVAFARRAIVFLLIAPFRAVFDFFRWRRAARKLGRRALRFAALAVWIMPVVLGLVFLALFGAANPIVEHWLSLIDLAFLLDLIELPRLFFWLFVVIAVWAFLRPRLPRIRRRRELIGPPAPAFAPARPPRNTSFEDVVFGRGAILRALVVFNLMFAVQTALDAAYLWGGVALPDGLTNAAYAHRGAYPLIVTALLAAGFVLAAMRPGGATAGDPLIRGLVYAWVGQNVVLVISSILRLDLYVGIYALTYWRIAAFIWMGLVAAGLVAIVARIALGRSNRWLLSVNLLTLSATLYVSAFVNFAALIANYNVDHSRQMSSQGVPLDICYLESLGPAAFPAIDRYVAHRRARNTVDTETASLARSRADRERWYREDLADWRVWTFRDWRLMRYLDAIPDAPPSGGPTSPR